MTHRVTAALSNISNYWPGDMGQYWFKIQINILCRWHVIIDFQLASLTICILQVDLVAVCLQQYTSQHVLNVGSLQCRCAHIHKHVIKGLSENRDPIWPTVEPLFFALTFLPSLQLLEAERRVQPHRDGVTNKVDSEWAWKKRKRREDR